MDISIETTINYCREKLRKILSAINNLWLKFKWHFWFYLGTLRAITFPLLLTYIAMISNQGQELFEFYGESTETYPQWLVAVCTLLIWSYVNYLSTLYILKYHENSTLRTNMPIAFMLALVPIILTIISYIFYFLTRQDGYLEETAEEHGFKVFVIAPTLVLAVSWYLLNKLTHIKVFSRRAEMAQTKLAKPISPGRIMIKSPLVRVMHSEFFKNLLVIFLFFLIGGAFSLSFESGSSAIGDWTRPAKFGSFGVVFLFVSFLVFFLGKITSFSDRMGIPFTLILFLYAATGSWLRGSTEVQFERNDENGNVEFFAKKLMPIADSFALFDEKKRNEKNKDAPIFVVATAGGGIRAAHFTASVLQAFCELTGEGSQFPRIDFKNNLLGISGVSGGTLGAAMYKLDFALPNKKISKIKINEVEYKINPACGKYVHSDDLWPDYLADVLGGYLFSEIALKLSTPITCATSLFSKCGKSNIFKDRGDVLAKSWRVAWSLAAKNENIDWNYFKNAKPIVASTDPSTNNSSLREAIFPLILANSTDAISGKRVVATSANIKLMGLDVIDFFDIASNGVEPAEIDFSQIVLNSARFSYASPSGTILFDHLVEKKNIKQVLRLIDGGYFENYGAETALELVRHYREKSTERPIVVIQISNYYEAFADFDDDPEEKLNCNESKGTPKRRTAYSPKWYEFFSEITTPITGFLATREARGILATKRLKCFLIANASDENKYFHINFGEKTKAPLGWAISRNTRKELKELAEKKTIKILSQISKPNPD